MLYITDITKVHKCNLDPAQWMAYFHLMELDGRLVAFVKPLHQWYFKPQPWPMTGNKGFLYTQTHANAIKSTVKTPLVNEQIQVRVNILNEFGCIQVKANIRTT